MGKKGSCLLWLPEDPNPDELGEEKSLPQDSGEIIDSTPDADGATY